MRKKGSKPRTKEPLYWLQWTRIATVTKTRLAKIMARSSTFSTGEVEGIMTDFAQHICNELLEGNEVEIQGLGTFRLKVRCKTSDNLRDLTAEGAEIDIAFEPDGDLRQRLRTESQFKIVSKK